MDSPQILVFAILTATMGLFLWGRFRHDVVALAALMAKIESSRPEKGRSIAKLLQDAENC